MKETEVQKTLKAWHSYVTVDYRSKRESFGILSSVKAEAVGKEGIPEP